MKITSQLIKTGLLCYYRFKCGAEGVATEVSTGIGIADIVAINRDHEVIEVEVKVSKSDLKSEATKKEVKHILLSNIKEVYGSGSFVNARPHRFYYCVPPEMEDSTIQFVNEFNPNYGVMVFNPTSIPEESITIVKSSRKLHSNDVYEVYRTHILKRNSNELASKYRKEYWGTEPIPTKGKKDSASKKEIERLHKLNDFYAKLIVKNNIAFSYDGPL